MAARLILYVSGHGFGHATRTSALVAALRALPDPPHVHVRSQAPHWIFTRRTPQITCSAAPIDVGVLQRNALDLDLPRTLEAHRAFAAGWEGAVEREARFLGDARATLVVGDVPPLAFAAARRAGVPAAAVANFSWDWILEAYASAEPRWTPIVERYREAYACAARLFRLPFHGELTAFRDVRDVPHLVNRSRRSRAECRAALGVRPGERRRLVLVSFGGFGGGAVEAGGGDALDDYLFVAGAPPPPGFRAEWIRLPEPAPLPHEDWVRAADALIGKPGYSTAAEVVAHGVRFLYVPRADFREIPALVAGLEREAVVRSMPRDDFVAGRWRRPLDALFEQEEARAPLRPRTDGAEVIAKALLCLT